MSPQVYALAGVVLVAVAALGLVVAVLVTGRSDAQSLQLVATVLGFAGTVIAVLLGNVKVSGQVAGIHETVRELAGAPPAGTIDPPKFHKPGGPPG